MTPCPIRFALTEAAVVELMNAITATTARRIAGEPDAPYVALKRRWREIGGMLELARRLETHHLVRALEAHKDALHRQMEAALRRRTTAALPRSGAPGGRPPLAAFPLPPPTAVNARCG